MAETLLSFGVEKLWNLLARESERFQGVEEQFNGLKGDLSMLRCLLKDVDANKHSSEMVRNIVKEIKEIVFDAEDIIETFLLKEDLEKTSGIKKRVKRLAWVIVDRRELASDIRAISKRISKVIRDMQSLGVQQIIVNETYTQSPQEIQREVRQTFSSDSEDHLVGLEKNVEIMVDYLIEEDSSNQVVCITGMGGIGKTTLARQVFNHKTIKSHFPGLAWVCVSQQFTRKYVWQTILRQLRPNYNVSGMAEEELQEKLVRVLETQKALIVIDDIWREGDWDRIKDVFLPKKGWKILLTSRNDGVTLHANPTCLNFKPECLNFEESWSLFQRIAFPRKDTTEFNIDEEMKEMGKQMIKHCGGLPLALKVLGGLLAPQYTLGEWTRVYENIKPHIIGGPSFNNRNISSVYNILCLSFEELPICLKQCFLYLAHFPEDYSIDVGKLSYYWAAEGMERPRYYDGASIRDVGDRYIEELVKRNMIIAERDVISARFEKCQLHDMMREVCLRKAEEENFLQIVDTGQLQALTLAERSQLPCKSRRLFIKSFDDTFCIENPKVRSLLHSWWKAPGLSFTRQQLMRVLDLSWAKFEGGKLPSSIGKLIHLRYLSLFCANVTHIPSSMRNLKQLIYLDLCVESELYMPNILKEMRELRYLYLTESLHDKVKMELGNLVNLETLVNFSTEHGDVRDLQGMTQLRFLDIEIRGKGCNMKTLSSSLSKLRCLDDLSINDKRKDDEDGFVLDCVHLRQLRLSTHMPRLPDEQHFPSHLTYLKLALCRLKEDPMLILKKLLHLKEVELMGESFCGRRMVCSRVGFPQLQKLKLDQLHGLEEWIIEEGSMPLLHSLDIGYCENLEEWIVEEGSMPLLHTLNISNCKELKDLHNGLRFITSLKYVSVKLSGIEWKNRILEEQFPSRLTTISLDGCRLEEDPMPILEKLLHLKKVILKRESFSGRRMVCSGSGFPQLQELKLWELNELQEWRVEEGSMPLLSILEIRKCEKLKELPDGLPLVTSLITIFLSEWKMRLSEGYLPSRLTYLKLSECSLEEDPMPILEKLLHLNGVYLGERAFCGRRMVCSRGGFPQLQTLRLCGLKELEEWIVEEGSMPLLNCLEIVGCGKLKELSDGLRFITSLKYLYVCGWGERGEEWKKRLSEGGEDYQKIEHIHSVR